MKEFLEKLYQMMSRHPLYEIIKFDYGMPLVEKMLKENKDSFNYYVVSCGDYNKQRLKSLLHAELYKKSIIDVFKKELGTKNVAIINYEHNKFIAITPKNLSNFIINNDENLKVGATERLKNDTVLSIFYRAYSALKEIGIRKLNIK